MDIAKNTVVSFDFILKNNDGQVLDSSEKDGPLVYLHGVGQLVPGLENELEGKKIGDRFDVSLAPKDAYGEKNDELIQKVPKSEFQSPTDLQVGMQFEVPAQGGNVLLTITAIEGDMVEVDGNHPLAGETLNFNITVTEVRAASEEEIAHGHVHGPGGHDH